MGREIYLRDALVRPRRHITGVDLIVVLGYLKFCELFTPAEMAGFDYSIDLHFWYSSVFSSPFARGLGVGVRGVEHKELRAGRTAPCDPHPTEPRIPHRVPRPLATNAQFQLLSYNSSPDTQILMIVNNGDVPLTGIRGCAESAHGVFPLEIIVAVMRKIFGETD
ncbi:hypothetical protein VTO73DRAFT_9882 [Trametes versicolor]